ncbi:hypothetical protein PIB30_019777 [Stylosanthes scabra]|uniref:Uncharacterized protein n=1 Tax=Stylosanthes scabra TaxID=79078 RepID=A0ABU6Y8M9_9FABA|nr:hypothetical protein [Stylosanthes scabra]
MEAMVLGSVVGGSMDVLMPNEFEIGHAGEPKNQKPKPCGSPTPYVKLDTQQETNGPHPSRPWSARSQGPVPSAARTALLQTGGASNEPDATK